MRQTTRIFSLGIDFSFVKVKGFSNSQCARFLGSVLTTLDAVVVGGARESFLEKCWLTFSVGTCHRNGHWCFMEAFELH